MGFFVYTCMKRIIEINDEFIKIHKLGMKEVFAIQVAKELSFGFTVQDFIDAVYPINLKYDTAYRILKRMSSRGLIEVNWDNSNGKDLYLIGDEKNTYLKIGRSNNPVKRCASLQTSSPLLLSILYTIPGKGGVESSLHSKFSTLREKGEWFRYDNRIIEEFERIVKKQSCRG